MSVHALAWVLRNSEARNGARLVLIALADFAHDDGTKAFPSIETLTNHTRLSRTAVKRCLRELEADGHIENVGETRSGTLIYSLRMGGSDLDRGGSDLDARGSDLDPNPLEEPPGEKTTPTATSSLNGGARGKGPLKVGGKVVNAEAWDLTGSVLDAYNLEAGSRLRLLTSAGQPSEAAKRIYGRVRDYPDIPLEKHVRIIRNTLASRWWGDGPPTIGVVFGPRVFEENITRRPEPERRGNGKQSAGDIIRDLMTAKEEANSGDVA